MVNDSSVFNKLTENADDNLSNVNLILILCKTSNQHDYTDRADWQLLDLDGR